MVVKALVGMEKDLFDTLQTHLPPDEKIIDVGPGRADVWPNGSRPKDPGILVMTDRKLIFYGAKLQMTVGMGWGSIVSLNRRTTLAGARLAIDMENGTSSEYYMGKVYSKQIEDFWVERQDATRGR